MIEGLQSTQAHLEKPPENVYSLSTASILDRATFKAALLWEVQDHVGIAQRSGYKGVELWPQGIRPLQQIRAGSLSDTEKAGVLSAHQCPRAAIPRSFQEVQKAVFLPETKASLADLDRIHTVVGDIPVVLFKETPPEYFQNSPFTKRGIQPDSEVCTAWGVSTAQEFVDIALKKGLTEIVIDTHHIRRPNIKTGKENPLANWQGSIPILLPHTKEIHIGIGRLDYGKMDPEQLKEEAMDLLTGGRKNTEVMQMLRLIADKGWNGMIVIEMRPSVYKDVMNRRFLLSGNDLVDIYERVRNTLYHTLDK